MKKGIVYGAVGAKYIKEVKESVDSLRKHLPKIPITVVSDRDFSHPGIDDVRIIESPEYNYGDSIIDISNIPYDQIVQLDSDTYITGDFSDLFEILGRFDIGVSINPGKRYYKSGSATYVPNDIPDGFPLFNSGVMLFKKNNRVYEFFDMWNDIYYSNLHLNEKGFNQPALREALYKSDVRLAPIPREYNAHTVKPGCVCGEIKIVHGRHPDIGKISEIINKSTSPRCYHNTSYPIDVTVGPSYGDASLYYKTRMSIGEEGIITTMKRGIKKIIT